jgi:hypothetical protein
MGLALLSLLMRRRFWKILPAVIGLVAVYYIASDGLLAMHERQAVEQLGDQLESYVPMDGLTVAFVDRKWRYPRGRAPNENELVARLTMNWPDEQREHFWAYAGSGPTFYDSHSSSANLREGGVVEPFGSDPRLSRPWRDRIAVRATDASRPQGAPTLPITAPGAERITRMLFVHEENDGGIHVERLSVKRQSP